MHVYQQAGVTSDGFPLWESVAKLMLFLFLSIKHYIKDMLKKNSRLLAVNIEKLKHSCVTEEASWPELCN